MISRWSRTTEKISGVPPWLSLELIRAPSFQKSCNRSRVAPVCRFHEGSPTHLHWLVNFCAVREEQQHKARMVHDAGLNQRSLAALVLAIWIRSSLQKHLADLVVTTVRRECNRAGTISR